MKITLPQSKQLIQEISLSRRCLHLIAVLLFLSFFSVTQAQTIEWDKAFGDDSNSEFYDVQQTSDGGYILGGYTSSFIDGESSDYDYWVIKLNATGEKEWDKKYGGSDADLMTVLYQTSDGGYILGGYSFSGVDGDKTVANVGESDFWLIKIDATGKKEWDRAFGGWGYDIPHSLQQTSDGGYIVGGSYGFTDYWVIKLDAYGEKEWDRMYGGDSYDELMSLQQTSDGGYILGGYSYSGASGDKSEANQGPVDYWVIKIDAAGIKEWDRTYGGLASDYLFSLQQTSDGGYILGGRSDSEASGNKTGANIGDSDYWVVKTDATGDIEWDRTFGGTSGEVLRSLDQTSDGGYILGGSSGSYKSGDKSEDNLGYCEEGECTPDYWVVKVNAAGEKEWDETIGGDGYDMLMALQQTSDGGYILGGTSYSSRSGDKTEDASGYWVVKLMGITTCTPPTVSIALKPTSNTYTGGDASHLYLGYGPQSIILQASGATSYTWSPATGLSSTSVANPVFTPTAPGTYTFTVMGVDGACTATASVTVTVTDVRCGNKNDKVLFCHRGQPICVSPKSVQAHLRYHPGDKLGVCGAQPVANAWKGKAVVQAYPNPFSSHTTIAFSFPQKEEYTLQVYDLNGNLVQQWPAARADAEQQIRVDWEPKRSKKGIYILRLVTSHEVQNIRLLRE
ncbi:T9SS type A sorting domain-containing protein [Pontibacter pamirensis]|uniref:T9SS type A sorting domain-containing protein n=1 Tax=Pontibacter pamirensis TaxID=2562824 RepID=UPI0013896CCE|nr:T9SS type A sorting domain-containing protein [Pontibacter pamirensis]